jgi:hypothetical protein
MVTLEGVSHLKPSSAYQGTEQVEEGKTDALEHDDGSQTVAEYERLQWSLRDEKLPLNIRPTGPFPGRQLLSGG